MTKLLLTLLVFSSFSLCSLAQAVKQLPPAGIEVPPAERQAIEKELNDLDREISDLRAILAEKPALLSLLPDVQIFFNAASYALKYSEFYNVKEFAAAHEQLRLGMQRAADLRKGLAPWTSQTGLVVRGFVSKLDGSVQPYGLVVPDSYSPRAPQEFRLDIWFHGRGDNLSEVAFLSERLKSPGQFTPRDTIVLHPYGRYCNANKFAGEVDTLEALESVRQRYRVDENRVAVRGFSMGGAATWHIAAHYPGKWVVAAPGAGFAETREYIGQGTKEPLPPVWERILWHLYDATDYALNFYGLPVVAYSGEIDPQKQAATVMSREMEKDGLRLTHIIGPQTAHKYHPDSIPEINHRVDAIVRRGRQELPLSVRFTTFTLKYNQMAWLQIDGLEKHWERATVKADLGEVVSLRTVNVSALTLNVQAGLWPFPQDRTPTVAIDGQTLPGPHVESDRSWKAFLVKKNGKWSLSETQGIQRLVKKHDLQGPIDDAFMGSFLFVRPTGKAYTEAGANWVRAELDHATSQWRSQFRGEVRIKDDISVTAEDIARHNLVLWGDPSSNRLIARVISGLPLAWSDTAMAIGGASFDPTNSVPVLIYPNPLNPQKYIVINSGFTFREPDYLSNARQTPKLPDWAILDISGQRAPYTAGRVLGAGFFDEAWKPLPPLRDQK